ncbi:MAG: class I mannose-6-phosphate isomerase [Bacteroidales bacterium]|nr:class I mannose-6-phosphate isomerase [Bacteroidales bacterium]NLK81341.1 mannose-6-phosphate isomerase [Bacteroidales bacterium]
MESLYPLTFFPQYKTRVWGGSKFSQVFLRTNAPQQKCGESWEISALPEHVSLVQNGFLAQNSLEELIEVYMDEIVGAKIYEKFGLDFPLLIKYIDANDVLSVQVHPNDELAKTKHNSYGKTELWYVIQADPDAELIMGFNKEITAEEFKKAINSRTITNKLAVQKVSAGDIFYIPAGLVHAIGKGILLAEIQQSSDITYRLYDWDRVDEHGQARELHIDDGIQAIDFSLTNTQKISYTQPKHGTEKIINSPFFTINIISAQQPMLKDYYIIDSFVIYMCVEGSANITYHNQQTVSISKGQTMLIPCNVYEITITPLPSVTLLEVYM